MFAVRSYFFKSVDSRGILDEILHDSGVVAALEEERLWREHIVASVCLACTDALAQHPTRAASIYNASMQRPLLAFRSD